MANKEVQDIFRELKRGHVLICERWLKGNLEDRWLSHQDEPFSLKDMASGEELRIYNVQVASERVGEPDEL